MKRMHENTVKEVKFGAWESYNGTTVDNSVVIEWIKTDKLKFVNVVSHELTRIESYPLIYLDYSVTNNQITRAVIKFGYVDYIDDVATEYVMTFELNSDNIYDVSSEIRMI